MAKRVLFLLIFFVNACQGGGCKDLDEQKCSALKDFVVFDQNHPLDFNHLCSEVGHHFNASWQTYAFFEKSQPDKNYKALMLAEVAVGWIRGPIGPNGISIQMEKFQIESLSDWAGENFSLALQVTNLRTGDTVTGDSSKSFSFSNPGGVDGGTQNYSLSEKGDFEWEKFTEPEEKKTKGTVYKHHDEIHVIAKTISYPEESPGSFHCTAKLKNPIPTDIKRTCFNRS